ncbi:hypothetical protein ACA910_013897 [Epithemia clementina (nom. ined.)]
MCESPKSFPDDSNATTMTNVDTVSKTFPKSITKSSDASSRGDEIVIGVPFLHRHIMMRLLSSSCSCSSNSEEEEEEEEFSTETSQEDDDAQEQDDCEGKGEEEEEEEIGKDNVDDEEERKEKTKVSRQFRHNVVSNPPSILKNPLCRKSQRSGSTTMTTTSMASTPTTTSASYDDERQETSTTRCSKYELVGEGSLCPKELVVASSERSLLLPDDIPRVIVVFPTPRVPHYDSNGIRQHFGKNRDHDKENNNNLDDYYYDDQDLDHSVCSSLFEEEHVTTIATRPVVKKVTVLWSGSTLDFDDSPTPTILPTMVQKRKRPALQQQRKWLVLRIFMLALVLVMALPILVSCRSF